jgi:hypothetical protein
MQNSPLRPMSKRNWIAAGRAVLRTRRRLFLGPPFGKDFVRTHDDTVVQVRRAVMRAGRAAYFPSAGKKNCCPISRAASAFFFTVNFWMRLLPPSAA